MPMNMAGRRWMSWNAIMAAGAIALCPVAATSGDRAQVVAGEPRLAAPAGEQTPSSEPATMTDAEINAAIDAGHAEVVRLQRDRREARRADAQRRALDELGSSEVAVQAPDDAAEALRAQMGDVVVQGAEDAAEARAADLARLRAEAARHQSELMSTVMTAEIGRLAEEERQREFAEGADRSMDDGLGTRRCQASLQADIAMMVNQTRDQYAIYIDQLRSRNANPEAIANLEAARDQAVAALSAGACQSGLAD